MGNNQPNLLNPTWPFFGHTFHLLQPQYPLPTTTTFITGAIPSLILIPHNKGSPKPNPYPPHFTISLHNHPPAMSQALLLLVFCFLLPIFQALPEPDPVKIHPFHPNPSPPETIPAFPEQSDVAGCPLNLPDELFHGIKTACSAGKGASGELRRSRCCPVLAAWLYSAYSGTALGRAKRGLAPEATPYDLPLLPDDSETCVDDLEKSLKSRGVELVKPNETCDVVYCFCGIRLHPLSCPEAFSVSSKGKLVGDESVKKLERDCLSTNGFPGLGGCSKCLNTLYLVSFSVHLSTPSLILHWF